MKTANIKYVELTDTTKLERYINETLVNAKTLQDRIQIAAVGILQHLGKHKDTDTALRVSNHLLHNLGNGIKVQGLIAWFKEHGGFVVGDIDLGDNKDKAKEKKGFVSCDHKVTVKQFQKAKKVHWVTMAPKNDWTGFDLETALAAVLTKAGQAQDKVQKGEEPEEKVSINHDRLVLLDILANASESDLPRILQAIGSVSQAEEEVEEEKEEVEEVESK